MIMRKVFPRFARGAVVFAHGAPGALAHVRAPASPGRGVVWRFLQAACFCIHAILCGDLYFRQAKPNKDGDSLTFYLRRSFYFRFIWRRKSVSSPALVFSYSSCVIFPFSLSVSSWKSSSFSTSSMSAGFGFAVWACPCARALPAAFAFLGLASTLAVALLRHKTKTTPPIAITIAMPANHRTPLEPPELLGAGAFPPPAG